MFHYLANVTFLFIWQLMDSYFSFPPLWITLQTFVYSSYKHLFISFYMDRCFHFSMCVCMQMEPLGLGQLFIWKMASFHLVTYSFTIPAMRFTALPTLSDSDSSYPRAWRGIWPVCCCCCFFHCIGSLLRHTGASLVGMRGLATPWHVGS